MFKVSIPRNNYDEKYKIAKRKVISKLAEVRAKIPNKPFDLKKAGLSEIRNYYFNDKPAERVVIMLRSTGCEWVKKSLGCTMCGHISETARNSIISSNMYLQQFLNEYKKYNFEKYPSICLYNSGSILNERELPKNAFKKIMKIISKNNNIQEVVIETRPEYINKEILEEMRYILEPKKITISVGLETVNDTIRDLCINKGFILEEFEKKARVVTSTSGVNLRTYILVKPPFVTEKEALDDAIKAVKYSFELGAKSVHLETCTVQNYTLVKYLWDRNQYNPPWLWSIIEILNATYKYGIVYVSPFRYLPLPKYVPKNCDICSERITRIILDKYNPSFDVNVLSNLSCLCRKKWKAEMMKKDNRSIPDRIIDLL